MMLFGGDGPLLFEGDFRPALFGEDRPREPIDAHREVVQSSQVDVRRYASVLQHAHKMYRLGFQDGLVADQIKGFVSHRTFVPMERRTAFCFGHFVHHDLPGPFPDLWIGGGKVRPCDVEIEDGLPVGLVFGGQEGLSFARVPGAQACLLSGGSVLTVENATAAKERESELHGTAPNPSTDQTARVREQWASFSGVVAGC